MLINYEDLVTIKNKNQDKRIALFKGTFDLFHYAHLKAIQTIKTENDILIIEIKCDKDVKKKGDNRPIINEFERAMIVDSTKYTDFTIISNQRKSTKLIQKLINENNYNEKEIKKLLRPDVIYTTNEKPVAQAIIDICKELSVEIKIIPMQGDIHTSDIIERCRI